MAPVGNSLRPGSVGLLLAPLLALAAGCPPASPPGPTTGSADALGPRWDVLFNGEDLDGWLKVRGAMDVAEGKIRMNPGPEGKSILLSRKVNAADGIVEARIARSPGPRGRGPYTLSVRLHADLLDWRAVYVVCRPDRVEMMRGGKNEAPDGVAHGAIEPVQGPELWRIRMQGPSVRCYRFGRLVAEYTDAIDEAGTVCITADGVDIEVLAIRYRPLASDVELREAGR